MAFFLYMCLFSAIIDLSCDFEATLCDWLPLQTNNNFHWKRGLRPYYRSPKFDHTTACEYFRLILPLNDLLSVEYRIGVYNK